MRIGEWVSWQPMQYNRYTGLHQAGRWSSIHLRVENDEGFSGATFACGKTLDDWYAEQFTDPPEEAIRRHRGYSWVKDPEAEAIKGYCKKCLKKAGIAVKRDLTKRGRDHQRQKCYDAERVTRMAHSYGEVMTVSEMQTYANIVTDTDWWTLTFGSSRPVRVQWNSKLRRYAGWYQSVNHLIEMRSKSEVVLVHELAHHAHTIWMQRVGKHAGGDNTSHGSNFMGCLIALYQHCIGKEFADDLRAACKAGGVSVADISYQPMRAAAGEE